MNEYRMIFFNSHTNLQSPFTGNTKISCKFEYVVAATQMSMVHANLRHRSHKSKYVFENVSFRFKSNYFCKFPDLHWIQTSCPNQIETFKCFMTAPLVQNLCC